jgi:hypothetical protein
MPNRILIVANQTLGGEDLAATVRARVAEGATELWIVVPATRARDQAPAFRTGGRAVFPVQDPAEAARALAEQRLDAARERFGALGIQLGGEVGDEDPFTAVRDVLARREVDEVIVSTLPAGTSRWLTSDLPSRVRREFSLPVTTVLSRVTRRD